MSKLPIGIQDFRELRSNGFLYVDKTEQLYQLTEGKYYFLSRPRRFGKSLLISTLAELFKGSQELFEGLWIENQWDWEQKHPVIHISFNEGAYKDVGLKVDINRRLEEQATKYGIVFTHENYVLRFRELIIELSKKYTKPVILIDEYDKPIIDYLDDTPKAKENREILKNFYSVLKPLDAHLRFVLLTGVSKFSKTSIFSELNNLEDITIDPNFPSITGYTQEELEHYFDVYIQKHQHKFGGREAFLAQVRKWYNGYSWDHETTLYNPFSILSFFKKGIFKNFWFETGTPTFLIKLLKKHNLYNVETDQATSASFGSFDIENISPTTLLFQTGYLTIQESYGFDLYRLGYPNQEVKSSMLQYLMASFTAVENAKAAAPALMMARALSMGELDQLQTHVNALLSTIPYDLHQDNEAYYHTIMHMAFSLIGVHVQSEIHVAKGRLDSIVTTDEAIYIFEFKATKSAQAAQDALAQIKANGYANPYLGGDKKVFAIGINFNTNIKEVDGWLIERL